MTKIVDVRGLEFAVGQLVARPIVMNAGGSVCISLCRVTRIENEKLYLDDSKQAMKFPGRLAILEEATK